MDTLLIINNSVIAIESKFTDLLFITLLVFVIIFLTKFFESIPGFKIAKAKNKKLKEWNRTLSTKDMLDVPHRCEGCYFKQKCRSGKRMHNSYGGLECITLLKSLKNKK